ncbi:hypothetical protein [Ferdinandcohnia sp. Marseille-Q9671]
MNLTAESTLQLHELEIHKDNKNYIIEDLITHEFYEMSEVCIDGIRLINDGLSLVEVERLLIDKYPNENINLLDFGQQLLELELVDMIDGTKVSIENTRNYEELGLRWIPAKLGKFFFNRFTRFIYPLLLLSNIILFITNTSLFPGYKDIFVFNTMMFNILLYAGISVILLLVHESGHILAIRSFNLPTRLQIGSRLFFVVLETDLTQAWKLSSKERILLFLAGVYFDSVLLFIALFLKTIIPFSYVIVDGILGLIVFDIVIRIIYQCCIYMKTDLYYVIENSTGNYNLMESGKELIKSISRRVRVSVENRVIVLYSFLYFIGLVMTFTVFIIYYIPQLVYIMKKVLPGFSESISSLQFWDAAIFSAQLLLFIVLLLYSWAKKYKEKKSYSTIYPGEENSI